MKVVYNSPRFGWWKWWPERLIVSGDTVHVKDDARLSLAEEAYSVSLLEANARLGMMGLWNAFWGAGGFDSAPFVEAREAALRAQEADASSAPVPPTRNRVRGSLSGLTDVSLN